MKHVFSAFLASAGIAISVLADPAVDAINEVGLALLAQSRGEPGNALISPFSIQSALAMAFAGAAGETREEMRRALFYPEDEASLHRSLAALRDSLETLARESEAHAKEQAAYGIQRDAISLTIANRLFGQTGYAFRPEFLAMLAEVYKAPFQECDFERNAEQERNGINAWVEEQTRKRIRDLIPGGALTEDTRLVLVNALYLKAPWMDPFEESGTEMRPFWIDGQREEPVPTMVNSAEYYVLERPGYKIIAIPYDRGDLQFLVFLPDQPDGLASIEERITSEDFYAIHQASRRDAILYLPKIKVESPSMPLKQGLARLGVRRAFDDPPGSADFDRMAPRRPDDYLFIHEVFHKTFLELDEKGTEAAAATAVVMMRATSAPVLKPKPMELRVDRPFFFAIQHRASGACLFMGRIRDPRE